MKVKKILSRRSMFKHEEKHRRIGRSLRMRSLPDEDAGIVFWVDFCKENNLPEKPNAANLRRYIEVFVNVQEERINWRAGLVKGDDGYRSGHALFTSPVLRLMAAQALDPTVVAEPGIATHVSPAPMQSSNGDLLADDTPQASTCIVSSNNKRPMLDPDTDCEDLTEDSSRASSAVSPPSKSPRSSHGNPSPPSATVVSVIAQETIHRRPLHVQGKTDSMPRLDDVSGPAGTTLNAGEIVDKYPQFKAQEFNTGLSGTLKPTEKHAICRETKTVPEVLQEWRHGLSKDDAIRGPAIQTLNNKFGGEWKYRKDKYIYESRRGVVSEYIRLVVKEGRSDTEAIELLERKRNGRSIATLYNELKATRPKMEKSVYGKDEPEYPQDLLYQERVPRPPPTAATKFPLPVRGINSILNIWKEWEEGWEGAPSIRSLIAKHNRAWNNPQFKKYENHFRYRNQLVRTIHEAVKTKAVTSHKDAIQALEEVRGAMEPSTFCKSTAFTTLLEHKWKISTKVAEWWKCGRYEDASEVKSVTVGHSV